MMNFNSSIDNFAVLNKKFFGTLSQKLAFLRNKFVQSPEELPEIILILSLISAVGGRCNSLYLRLLYRYIL